MIIANKYEVPDKCPEDCPFQGDTYAISQGGACTRCPVFCCSESEIDGESYGEEFRLMDAKGYRPDWAVVWSDWFANDYKILGEKVSPLSYCLLMTIDDFKKGFEDES